MKTDELNVKLNELRQKHQASMKDVLSTEKNLEMLKADVAHLGGQIAAYTAILVEFEKQKK